MKTLLLLRHAKSSWADPARADFDRPLNDRGRRAAPAIGGRIAAAGLQPDLVLCSAAQRTRETLGLILPNLCGDAVLRIESGLYNADATVLLDRLRRVDAAIGTIMVIAHNPGLEDLATTICGGGDETLMRRMAERFPTAALAIFSLDAPHWTALSENAAILKEFVVPRDLA
ncbi:MAG: histidine phosphatase family protein [Rhodospirillaceae bacterium]|nr:histidine phosphatase family protein [Rhodospirillaceae bacterium]MBT6116309.1 histidine phosphatase family protein [Rhodospirillaceae bacterium]